MSAAANCLGAPSSAKPRVGISKTGINKPPFLSPSTDYEGLRLAAIEIFESSLSDPDGDSVDDARTLSDGYYRRVHYLLSLESLLESGVRFSITQLLACEALGLAALRRARSEFREQHPPCAKCGALQHSKFAISCRDCGANFRSSGGSR